MRGLGKYLRYADLAVLGCLALALPFFSAPHILIDPAHAAESEPAVADPIIPISFGNTLQTISGDNPLCEGIVSVCGRQLNPLGVELGGTFTVRINDHYKSSFECMMVDGRANWIPISVYGTCEKQPVIMLPAKYEEAWNVG